MNFTAIRPQTMVIRFGQEATSKNAEWAAQKLRQAMGVPADLLSEPKLTDEHVIRMSTIIRELSDAERLVLKTKAEKKELSDWRENDRILPENFERKLVQLINDLI